jgi:hypothetical protein
VINTPQNPEFVEQVTEVREEVTQVQVDITDIQNKSAAGSKQAPAPRCGEPGDDARSRREPGRRPGAGTSTPARPVVKLEGHRANPRAAERLGRFSCCAPVFLSLPL